MYHRLLYLCVSFWIEHKLLKLKELMVKDKKTTVTKENFFFLWAYFISFWYIPVFDGWCNSYNTCMHVSWYLHSIILWHSIFFISKEPLVENTFFPKSPRRQEQADFRDIGSLKLSNKIIGTSCKLLRRSCEISSTLIVFYSRHVSSFTMFDYFIMEPSKRASN